MLILGFAIFIAFLSAIPFWSAVCLRRRPERMFLTGLFFNGLLFYVACALNMCNAGFYAILIGNLALYVPAVLKLRKSPGSLRRFRVPALPAFYILIAAGFMLAMNEKLLLWDEFSYWSTSAKLLLKYGVLNCAQDDLLKHASYPPGLPVLYTLVHKCFIGVGFQDFLPRFAARTLILCVFIIPLGDSVKRLSFRCCATGMLLLYVVLAWLFPLGAWSCQSDCILGVVFAAAVYAVMRHDRSCEDDLFLALLLAWLFLIKKAGMGFAVMTQILYVVRWIADRRSGEEPKRSWWSALVVLAAPFVMQLSWSLLLKIYHTRIIFPVGDISFVKVFRLIRYGEPERAGWLVPRFLGRLPEVLWVFVIPIAGLALLRRTTDNRPRRSWDLLWFLPLALLVFTASILLTYLFIFDDDDARKLGSYVRYFDGFMLMPIMVWLMLAISGLRRKYQRRVADSYITVALLLVVLGICHRNGNENVDWKTATWPQYRAEINARYGSILRAPDGRFIAVTGTGGGLFLHLLRNEFELHLVDEIEVPPAPEGSSDVRPEPVELKRRFREARYVLFLHPRENLAREYAELWETPPEKLENPSLYEVAPDGRLRSVR